jgi:protein-S-isoprenylcysteine O-methyltransferase Ste14
MSDRPNTIPWPPIIFAAAVIAAFALGRVAPIGLPATGLVRVLGWGLIALGIALDVWAMQTMRRASANILPHRAATALVSIGPFLLTRNPIYLGNTIAVAGAAGAFDNPWFAVAALIAAVLVQRLAIRREETHLAALFGSAWQDYARRVPRWLG